MGDAQVHVFGVRHHGPGSARSLRAALRDLKPDCVLIEGPPDADDLIAMAGHAGMTPPVALLVYRPDQPRCAVYYPFAVFSPEWQAMRYALEAQVPVRFMDLPQAHRLADLNEEDVVTSTDTSRGPPDPATPAPDGPPPDEAAEQVRLDPLAALAQAAGYEDSERWWEQMVEMRQDGTDLFAAIREAMSALRENCPEAAFPDDPQREAYMRQSIRTAQKEGHERIAVVCGAWHAPVLADMPPAKNDAALLKGLPKAKVAATWVPWTHGRLTFASGYGAGVRSPGYYHHLWTAPDHVVPRWMTRVARLFREHDIDCSSAHVIESVRLAETLASLRNRPIAGLEEMNEAALSIFCFDSDAPMRLIAEKLIVGETLGDVPDDAPTVPLQQDLAREQKRLRLKPEAEARSLELDLRKELDLDRSRLLHRLNLLGIGWGQGERVGGKGTFKEAWRLKWEPELAIAVIEAAIWGNSVRDAASGFARDQADKATALPTLTAMLDRVILADLSEAVDHIIAKLDAAAAVATDVALLMAALPPLVNVLRYGNVRQTDAGMIHHVVRGLIERICIGLPNATGALNDDAAEAMYGQVVATHGAITLLQDQDLANDWLATLRRLADQDNASGLLAGRACRLLMDQRALAPDDVARRLGLALSAANDPSKAASWLDGFLRGSGVFLLHDDALWQVLDEWVTNLQPDTFTNILPLVRRTFATFEKPERRMLGERAKRTGATSAVRRGSVADDDDIDLLRAEAVLPLLSAILGLDSPPETHS